MKAARLTAASVHHFADPRELGDRSGPAGLARSADLVLVPVLVPVLVSVLVSVLADTTIVLSRCLGLRPVFVPWFIYVVLIRRTGTLYSITCTAYSCQGHGRRTSVRRAGRPGPAQQARRHRPRAQPRPRRRARHADHPQARPGPRRHPDGAVLALPQQGRPARRRGRTGLGR